MQRMRPRVALLLFGMRKRPSAMFSPGIIALSRLRCWERLFISTPRPCLASQLFFRFASSLAPANSAGFGQELTFQEDDPGHGAHEDGYAQARKDLPAPGPRVALAVPRPEAADERAELPAPEAQARASRAGPAPPRRRVHRRRRRRRDATTVEGRRAGADAGRRREEAAGRWQRRYPLGVVGLLRRQREPVVVVVVDRHQRIAVPEGGGVPPPGRDGGEAAAAGAMARAVPQP